MFHVVFQFDMEIVTIFLIDTIISYLKSWVLERGREEIEANNLLEAKKKNKCKHVEIMSVCHSFGSPNAWMFVQAFGRNKLSDLISVKLC